MLTFPVHLFPDFNGLQESSQYVVDILSTKKQMSRRPIAIGFEPPLYAMLGSSAPALFSDQRYVSSVTVPQPYTKVQETVQRVVLLKMDVLGPIHICNFTTCQEEAIAIEAIAIKAQTLLMRLQSLIAIKALEYFQDRGGFSYNPSKPAWTEFRRLARYLDWSEEEEAQEKEDFRDVLAQTFNYMYGTDENSLESWTALCHVLRITPAPEGLNACREVEAVHVNLVDFVDHPNTGTPVWLFSTEAELSEYTLETGKFFPRESAYAGGLLKYLLRHIQRPGLGYRAGRLEGITYADPMQNTYGPQFLPLITQYTRQYRTQNAREVQNKMFTAWFHLRRFSIESEEIAHAPQLSDRFGSNHPFCVVLREYFRDREGFRYNPSKPAWKEFRRLSRYLDWSKEKEAQEKEDFKDALVQTFNYTYGTDENRLESWTALCHVLRITPAPEGLNACREAVKAAYVNLVDLVDHSYTGEPVQLFNTEAELGEYTRGSQKFFPKENAYAGGLLKYLLRHINNPRTRLGARGTSTRPRCRRR
ncbi:hypothetical protein C0995_008740 [Termitomyces sp. Mi166|nr:hypothetical protein C0995_008740 [Termitomyces sp. Mi166\